MDDHMKLVKASRKLLRRGIGPYDADGYCRYCDRLASCEYSDGKAHWVDCEWATWERMVNKARTTEEPANATQAPGDE